MTKARLLAEETHRLYSWEDRTKDKKGFPYVLVCERTMPDLQDFTDKVWESHGRAGWSKPIVKAWNGLCWRQRRKKFQGWSFSTGRDIKLAKRHRNKLVLIHEIVHAMGYDTHGRGFVRKYAELLVEFGGIDRAWLELSMGMFGIKLC